MTLSFIFRHGVSTIRKIVLEGTHAIRQALKDGYCSTPSDPKAWRAVAKDFQTMWNLPHCLGAVDGKHMVIQAPANSGSTFFKYCFYYFKYKGTFSINLMAMSDTNYCFLSVDVGESGHHSDGGVFSASGFGHALLHDQIPLPPNEELQPIRPFPYYFVGNEASPLKTNLMRPYPGQKLDEHRRVFNYRLSCGGRVIKNAFGILVARWRMFRQPIIALLEYATQFTLGRCCPSQLSAT